MKNSILNHQEIKDATHIRDVIDSFLSVGDKKKICCPFHDDRTPSFSIDDKRNIATCFGQCNKSYDSIAFLEEHEGMEFVQAIGYLSNLSGIHIRYEKGERQVDTAHRQLYLTNQTYLKHGKDNFGQAIDNDTKLENLLQKRGISPETGNKFDLFLVHNNIKPDLLLKGQLYDKESLFKLGILNAKEEYTYHTFANRLVFPIKDKRGQVVGFAGRCLNNKSKVKYINSKESDIFQKGQELYGLYEAKGNIRKENQVFIVEGYFDVLAMHEIGYGNTIGLSGTSMNENQLELLTPYTKNITLMLDGDDAGLKAICRIIPMAMKLGFNVGVVPLHDAEDPCSYIKDKGEEALSELLENKINGLRFLMENSDTSDYESKQNTLETYVQLIGCIRNDFLVRELNRFVCDLLDFGLSDLKRMIKENRKESENHPDQNGYTKSELNSINAYGIFERNNTYYKVTEKNVIPLSNFILKPHYHIIGETESYRLMEIINRENLQCLIPFNAKSLVSLDVFSETVENKGNYLFFGNKRDLGMIKSKIFPDITTCQEISVLGWNRQGFYAFSNGILDNNEFYPSNENGIINYKDKVYFIPASSSIYKEQSSDFNEEKRFSYHKGKTSLLIWSELFTKVYKEDENGYIAILFYIASLYRDIVFDRFRFFPHLFLFGQKGTGKSQLAWSLGAMFGDAQDQFMLDSGTNVGMYRKVAKFRNALVWYDEYKNSIDNRRIQFLKGVYDGAGHVKGIKSQNNRTTKTGSHSACIISGQDMPTKDIALFSRSILLKSTRTEHNQNEREEFLRLKELEEDDHLVSITGYLLSFRNLMESSYYQNYKEVFELINRRLEEESISFKVEDRILKNMSAVVAVYWTLRTQLEMKPFEDDKVIEVAVKNIISQSSILGLTNDTSQFWDMVEYLTQSYEIMQDEDYEVKTTDQLKYINNKGESEEIRFPSPTPILYIRLSKVIPKYKEFFRKQNGYSGLDKGTLLNYLEHSDAFIGKKKSHRFGKTNNSSCLLFHYSNLSIELQKSGGSAELDL